MNKSLNKAVDIIVPVWNEKAYTEMFVNSVLNKTKDFNLIIVDNGSDKETYEYLLSLAVKHPFVHVVRHEKNQGYTGGINSGIEFSLSVTKSPFIVAANNDIILPENWFDNFKKIMDDNKDVAVVGPVSNAIAGRQHVKYNNVKYSTEETNLMIGMFYMIRSDVVRQLISLDGFYLDEKFNFSSSDDLDLSIRVRKMNYRMMIDRNTYVHHFMSKTLVKLTDGTNEGLNNLHGKGQKILSEKWGDGVFSILGGYSPRILIGVPTVGMMDHRFWKTTMMLNIPYQHAIETVPRKRTEDARNELAELALKHGMTHLLFLDDDMIFDDQHMITKMVAHNVDVVGVRAYTRAYPHYPCVFYKPENTEFYKEVDFESCGLREVEAIGASCTLISTEIFRKMEYPWFEFPSAKILGRDDQKFGEDVNFCKKAKKNGFKVFCDTDIEISHIGDNQIINRKSFHRATGKS